MLAFALLMPLAAALPDVDIDRDHALRSAARAACTLAPDDGVRDGTLSGLPAPAGLDEALDAMEGDLEDPKAWCRGNADNLGDVVEIDAFF